MCVSVVKLNKGGETMTDYKSMYLKLFNTTTDTINELKKVQCECEEMYISSKESFDKVKIVKAE